MIEPSVHGDQRGYFMETYNQKDMEEAGLTMKFVQDNQSGSGKAVLRGLHFQKRYPQGKLVRVIRGTVFDVAVDIRKGSATYGKWYGIELSEENKKQFYIPEGFAHGFLVLSDQAEFCYKCTDFYHPDDEGGIAWNDPTINVAWPELDVPYRMSEKINNGEGWENKMERIQGLKEYVQTEHYLEGIGIGKEEQKEIQIAYQPLAQGEYNINYWFVHPLTGKKLVLRVNTGSQMHLENQIEYEYHALELLADSGRTPVPVFVDGSKKELPYGMMVMEFLEGSTLDYRKNLMEAAECLADIHSVPVKETDGLISPSNPLQAILDECNQMVQTYYESDLGEEKKKVQIRRLLELGQEKINEIRDYSGYRCCINTELNSGNFLMNGAGKDNYLVDWEKPLYGDPVQDLGHFLAPTTTFWKTDVILTEEEMADFTRKYIQAVNGRFDVSGIEERLNIFIPITCLRGITWCAMAWVEYQEPGRLIRNEETFKKMEDYLNRDFLDMIEERYYK